MAIHHHEIIDRAKLLTPSDAAERCRELGVSVVAVDAPSRWSLDGRARSAERQLMAQRIFCFSTPTETAARSHPKNHFGWMVQGQNLYVALGAAGFPLGTPENHRSKVAIETFPHAVACAISNRVLAAKQKRRDRQVALAQAGVMAQVRGIDFLDAALCAVVAQRFASSDFHAFGSYVDGYIVLPKSRLWGAS